VHSHPSVNFWFSTVIPALTQTAVFKLYKVKDKIEPRTGHEGPVGELRYSPYPFFNLSARWGWVVNATPRPLYPSGKTQYPLYRRLGGPQGRSGQVQKILPPRPSSLQQVTIKVKVKSAVGVFTALQPYRLIVLLTPLKEFLHSSLEALHTSGIQRPQLAKEGTMNGI
jgi:hypothetical protein